ncbi:winged helix-turn-helix transcriptional regulator [Desulfogranum japonicum]|uniref:winged helix-turn-helix transcriptional regulator n=1 Tax=Desulfogranum japonicum TaxID=231447 RepID=UPI00048E2031|nr:helix-turn-helix domain-containing protein [Desulfogranum japonicum]
MKECTIKHNGNRSYSCTVELTLQVIGGKWKPVILYHLSRVDCLRFGELKKSMPNITQKMLTQQLRELEQNGLVNREVYAQVPPKVEYSLTTFGLTILPVLNSLREWGDTFEQRLESV